MFEEAGIESKGLHRLRHTFATNLVNGVKQPDGVVKSLTIKQVADLLGHSTTQVTEMYYVKKDTSNHLMLAYYSLAVCKRTITA